MRTLKSASITIASILSASCHSNSAILTDVQKKTNLGPNIQLYSPLSDPSNIRNWIYQADLSDEVNGNSFDRSVWHNMGKMAISKKVMRVGMT